MTKTHPERDFTERAISMLKAYENLEDSSPISSYTHEKFGSFFIDFVRAKVESKQTIEPIDYLQIPFRIAQFCEDSNVKKEYENYIKELEEKHHPFPWKLQRLEYYKQIPNNAEKIYDDEELFENKSLIGKEFYFCYRLAQYAQICKEQGHPEYAACFCGIYPKKSNNLPEDLQKILESDVSVNSQDFWEKYKQYFNPQCMNSGTMDSFLKKFLLGINKNKPQKVQLREILLKARLFNIIWLPYNKIKELDPEANEDFFLKVHILKNKGNIQSTNFADFIKKIIKTSNEKSFDGTLGFLGHKWSIALLLKVFTDIPHRKESISHLLSSGTGKSEILKKNLDWISYTSSFPILDKIQYPLNEESEPRWLYPLIKVFHNLVQKNDSIDIVPQIIKFANAINNNDKFPEIENDDPSANSHIYIIIIVTLEFLLREQIKEHKEELEELKKDIATLKSLSREQIKEHKEELEELKKDITTRKSLLMEFQIPESFVFVFRIPNLIAQIISHPKINTFTTTYDIATIATIVPKMLNELDELVQDPQKFCKVFSGPNFKHEEFKQLMEPHMLKTNSILQQLEKTDLQNHN